jgi:hypothetical protein
VRYLTNDSQIPNQFFGFSSLSSIVNATETIPLIALFVKFMPSAYFLRSNASQIQGLRLGEIPPRKEATNLPMDARAVDCLAIIQG